MNEYENWARDNVLTFRQAIEKVGSIPATERNPDVRALLVGWREVPWSEFNNHPAPMMIGPIIYSVTQDDGQVFYTWNGPDGWGASEGMPAWIDMRNERLFKPESVVFQVSCEP